MSTPEMVVAFSGGKDSTAMAVELHRWHIDFSLMFTPTGDEPPGVVEHIESIANLTGADLIIPPAPTLDSLVCKYLMIPNFRSRWCTREIKIEPAIGWFKKNPGHTLAVGLRADEPNRNGGIYGDLVRQVFPLRDWGWRLEDVQRQASGLCIPSRTDCGLCFFQRIDEWQRLWLDYPDHFDWGVQLEEMTGHTFRTPGRDTWPTSLRGLRRAFESGRSPRRDARQMELFGEKCRVCSL